jgi:hypothetical protein
MMTQREQDAALACLAWYAEDMYDPLRPDELAPVPDPRIAGDGWQFRGYLTAMDAYVRLKEKSLLGARRYYGYLAESVLRPGNFTIAVRGTMDLLEWFEDIEGEPVAHPTPNSGRIHLGFWDIYASMQYDAPRSVSSVLSAWPGLRSVLGSSPVTIVGHSLGSPLSTYLAYDLARNGCNVSAILVASPRPGDADFARAFAGAVPNHRVYNNVRDLVPRVPVGFGYTPLPNVAPLDPGSLVEDGPFCNHHCADYIAMMNLALLTPARISASDRQYLRCVPKLGLHGIDQDVLQQGR